MHVVSELIQKHYRSDCVTPLLHRDIVIPVEFFESRDIRFVYTLQQPGEFIVTLPMGWHQVANDGCNLSEAVNVYCDGWPVVAGRQKYCNCRDRGTTYNSEAWDPIIHWLQYGEQQMMVELADSRFDVEALEIPEDPDDIIPDYRDQSNVSRSQCNG
uniref:JmjC domain-containing protein n=1 Tax=Panagrolaimus superbus TaxID=310955 RepID=A0A914YCD9_9BILA